jgi:hypothetical protein
MRPAALPVAGQCGSSFRPRSGVAHYAFADRARSRVIPGLRISCFLPFYPGLQLAVERSYGTVVTMVKCSPEAELCQLSEGLTRVSRAMLGAGPTVSFLELSPPEFTGVRSSSVAHSFHLRLIYLRLHVPCAPPICRPIRPDGAASVLGPPGVGGWRSRRAGGEPESPGRRCVPEADRSGRREPKRLTGASGAERSVRSAQARADGPLPGHGNGQDRDS